LGATTENKKKLVLRQLRLLLSETTIYLYCHIH